MKRSGWSLAVTVSVALAAAALGGTAGALPADRAPCEVDHAAVAGGCPRQAAALPETDEDRVAKWLVERIQAIDLCADPVIDFTAAEITAATGVDAARLDLDRIRERVLARLREASRWGEVRLRVEERDESRAADDGRRGENGREAPRHDGVRTGAAAVSAASHRSVAPATAPRQMP